jgi:3-oxoacyl-[acyl-carrier protein] reductase
MKSALIWGAAGGIGRAVVEQLAGDGWTVLTVTRHPLKNLPAGVHNLDADVSDPYEIQLAVNSASQLVDEVNLWLYAAGDITSAKVVDLSPEAWQCLLQANLTGAFLTTHYSLPLLAADAHLVYLGALSERLRLPGLSAYAAAKAGLEAFVETLAKEERRRRVTIVRPAAVDTPLWQKVPLRLPPTALTPETLAQRIIEAHHHGHKGALDLA